MESAEAKMSQWKVIGMNNVWEYKKLILIPDIPACETELQLAGEAGWELVSVYPHTGSHFAWFKRRKESA